MSQVRTPTNPTTTAGAGGRHRTRRAVGAIGAAVVAAAMLSPAAGANAPAPERGAGGPAAESRPHWADGYAWANDPNAASYTPSSFYAFNRTGGAVEITKPSGTTGRYKVRFAGLSRFLGSPSTVQVTSYGSSSNYCKPANPKLGSDTVDVRCYDAATKKPANGLYTVLVTRNYTDLAFAYANKPTAADYAPPSNASWNPGGAIRVRRSGPGAYQAIFAGLGARTSANGGHVQVSAISSGKNFCIVVNWFGNPDLTVTVQCYTAAGSPVDAKFNVLFTLPSAQLAYAWASQPTSASYTPSTFYSSNPGGGAVGITRSSVGVYTVVWNGLSGMLLDGGDVQVTAYGGTPAHCGVSSWGSQTAVVRCLDPNGRPLDTFYTVLLAS